MRPDLAKCTTERSRAGGSYSSSDNKYGGKVRIHPDPEHDYPNEFGGYRSSARHRHFNPKSLTDSLSALQGNIRKNIGRPWNDVFSEFSRLLDRRSISGHHIWTHLMQEVEINTVLIGGEVYPRTARFGYRRSPLTGYYVHPVTGILEYKQPKYNWPRKKKDPVLSAPNYPGWDYQKIDGIWFRVRTSSVKNYFGQTEMVVTERRSASKKEIQWIKAQAGVL